MQARPAQTMLTALARALWNTLNQPGVQAGGAVEAEALGNQGLWRQSFPDLNQPKGQVLPVFILASRSLSGLLMPEITFGVARRNERFAGRCA